MGNPMLEQLLWGIALFKGKPVDISYRKGKEEENVLILGKGWGLDGQGKALPNQPEVV